MKVIAQRGESLLLAENDQDPAQKGWIYDPTQQVIYYPPRSVVAIMGRGYWEPYDGPPVDADSLLATLPKVGWDGGPPITETVPTSNGHPPSKLFHLPGKHDQKSHGGGALSATLGNLERELAGVSGDAERLYIVSPAGQVLGRYEGDVYGVGPKTEKPGDREQYTKLVKGNILMHNHPNNATFSTTDIDSAATYEYREIRVVTKDRTYSMRPGSEGWNAKTADTIWRKTPDLRLEVYDEYFGKQKPNPAGLYGSFDTSKTRDLDRVVWQRVAKMVGMVYEEHPPSGGRKEAVEPPLFHLPGQHAQKAHGGGAGSMRETYTDMNRELGQIAKGTPSLRAVSGPVSPSHIANITDNAREAISQYDSYLAGETVTAMHKYVARWERTFADPQRSKELAESGLDAKHLDDLMQDNVKKIVYQEVESNRQQFTDHGVRHIAGNLQYQSRIMDVLEEQGVKISAKDRLIADFAMVNHDVGYTIPAIRAGGLEGVKASSTHPQVGAKIADEQRSLWNEGKVFSKEEYVRATNIIRTHSSSDLSLKDPVALATRIADNTSLFHREKLPGAFARVPEGRNILIKMQQATAADNKDAFEASRSDLHKAIDSSNYEPNLKRDLKAAAGEINYYTPKFALGTLAGRIEDVSSGSKDALVSIKVKYNEFDSFLQKSFDMGQKQTKKLLSDYGESDFTKDSYRLGDAGSGKAVLKIEIERPPTSTATSEPHLFHLPGKHDQKTHGKGGAASGSYPNEESHLGGTTAEDAMEVAGWMDRGENVFDNEARSAAKRRIVEGISERLRDDPIAVVALREEIASGNLLGGATLEGVVNNRIHGWAETSGDTDPVALSMQMAIRDEFGLNNADPFLRLKDVDSSYVKRVRQQAEDRYANNGTFNRRLVRAMYEHTQSELKNAGIEQVTLQRGLRFERKNPAVDQIKKVVTQSKPEEVQDPAYGSLIRKEGVGRLGVEQPANSWTTNVGVAEDFGASASYGTVLTATYPRSRILGTARTGFGALPEREFVVLSGPGEVHVRLDQYKLEG